MIKDNKGLSQCCNAPKSFLTGIQESIKYICSVCGADFIENAAANGRLNTSDGSLNQMTKYGARIEWESESEAYSDYGIECPHCHYVDDDPKSIYINEDEREVRNCGSCEKDFTVSMHISHSWTSLPIHPEFNPQSK